MSKFQTPKSSRAKVLKWCCVGDRRKIRLIEGIAKMSFSKKIIAVKGGRRGEGVEPERRLEGPQFTNMGRKYQHG